MKNAVTISGYFDVSGPTIQEFPKPHGFQNIYEIGTFE